MKKWGKPNKAGLHPRWAPSYGVPATENDEFLGYAGPFDVWFDNNLSSFHDGPVIVVVCDESTKGGTYNFDTFRVLGENLEPVEPQDLNIDPYHMCLIYQLCVDNNIFVREDPNG